MKNYIDIDAALVELCRGCSLHSNKPDFFCGTACAKHDRISTIPPVDVREVICCRDCSHWDKHGLCDMWSAYGMVTTIADGFCHRAERRERQL